ncbi:MAG: DNA-directed RNA polymerase subunit beta [Proteobacteria bacterium]|nr:DNA-directed RNA polymerase subunit beta [Pseudomonadota bacterium]NCA28364.1 DNA-directed RNA polymerase subunit beta [Pseudomonadota bacterium]
MVQSRNFDQSLLRKSFSNNNERETIPHLISLQKESYEKFLQSDIEPSQRKNIGIQSVFNSFFPITDSAGKVSVEFISYTLKEPRYESSECLSAGKTYSSALSAHLRLILWHQEEGSDVKEIRSIKEQEVYLCEVPLMTDSGSFIFNGAERVIVSQMRRAPGVFFDSENAKISGSKSYTAKIIPHIGSWLDFEYDSKDILHFRIDKKRKIPATTLLRAIGLSSENIIQNFYGSFEASIDKKGWSLKFDQNLFNSKKIPHDLICAKSGEVVVKEGTKINRKLIDKLIEDKFENYLLTDEALLGFVYAQDLIENETGELLLEAGSIVTAESLQILEKLNFKKVAIVNPSKSDIGPYVYNTLLVDKNTSQKDALYDIYKAVRLGEAPSSAEIAKNYFDNLFFNDTRYNLSDVGRMKMNHRLGLDISTKILFLTNSDVEKTIKILSQIKHNDLKTDDIDNLANRRVRAVGELVENQMRIGMTRVEKSIIEKINSVEVDTLMPQAIINSKPLITAVKDFFATSQLSQFMDQTNPLSDITHKRRLSALGPGGLTRERAGFEVRDVHPTHYGRICPIETPEGQNIGLINSLATYARVNDFGFIETPYRKVVNGKVTSEVQYLSAMGEVNFAIAQSNIDIDEKGKIKSDLVSCRKNGEFIMLTPDKIDFMDVSTKQIVSVATTLIPFLENDDANRALMGSNMQRQAVPLLRPDAPLVGTGMESVIATDSGATVRAKHDGIVKFVDSSRIVIEYTDDDGINKIDICNLKKYVRTNQDTCINQRPTIEIGQHVKAGQIISDGHSIANGEIALGKNVRVAFMPWNGYNFEDSIIISEKLLADDTFTSIHIEELEVVARDTRLGPEEITRDIPNVSEEVLAKLDEEGIIHIGAEVKAGDILVGKTTPKSESPMTPEEKLLKVIFGEKAADVKDSSLYVPTGVNGTIVDVRVFLRKGIEKDERSIYIEMQQIEELSKAKNLRIHFLENSIKDSLINLFADHKITNTIEKIKSGSKLDKDTLSVLSKSQLFKIVVSDSSIMDKAEKIIKLNTKKISEIEKEFNDKVSRIKAGEELGQGILKIVKIYIATKYRLQPGDKMAGRHGNKGVVSKIAPIEDMPYSEDGEPVDIVLNPLGVPSRMNVGQILETHLGFASKELGKKIGKMLDDISYQKAEYIKKLRSFLLEIYSSEIEAKNINSMSDNELIEFSRHLKNGVPFATGIFEGAKEGYITKLLEIAGVDSSGQIQLFDGKTGEKFDRKVTVGYIYMLKLHHLVDDKIHARSIGPYSLITQQPLGGKSHFGGQRFGEMECWALQAYGAAYTLQEMLTVKSDDVVGRIKIYESIIQGNQNFNCSIPESFNVMIKEVRSLGLNIELIEE